MSDPSAQPSEEATARELLRCVGASVSELRIERILEYRDRVSREALERAARALTKLKPHPASEYAGEILIALDGAEFAVRALIPGGK